jgi:hypothetical protein
VPAEERSQPTRFLVEVGHVADGDEPDALTKRARRVTDGLGSVRYLRTIYVPEDASSYLLFEAASPAALERALHAAGIEIGVSEPAIAAAVTTDPRSNTSGGSR